MVKFTIVALVSTAVVMAIGIQLSASGRLYESGASRLEATGVCRMSETEISCWDMDGKVSKALTDLITTSATSVDTGITVRFGRKNRWLVVRRQGIRDALYEPLNVKMHGRFYFGDRNSSFGDMFAISTEPECTGKVNVAVTMHGMPGSPPVDLKLQKGQSIRYESVEVTVINWVPGERHGVGMHALPSGTPTWKIELQIRPAAIAEPPTLEFGAVGTAGQVVKDVDMAGNPVFIDPGSGRGRRTMYKRSSFWTVAQTSDRLTLGTSVRPEQIGFLRVSGTHGDTAVLRGFPLDPVKR
jgi:hypothetical protein